MPSRIGVSGSKAAKTDKAETFVESVVLTGHSSTRIAPSTGGTTATREADDGTFSGTNGGGGVQISPNTDLLGVSVTVSANSGTFETIEVQRDSDGEIIGRASGSWSPGDVATVPAPMDSGTKYNVFADRGVDETYGYYGSATFPYSSGDVDITAGYSNGVSDSYVVAFSDVTAIVADGEPAHIELDGDATSGTVHVEWPDPQDIYAWDTALFQTSPDNETIDVYVEEYQGGSWTEIAGPISRGDSIGADPSNNVRYRAELSRTDTANNPTLDAIYRRIKL